MYSILLRARSGLNRLKVMHILLMPRDEFDYIFWELWKFPSNAMVTNHLRAPYGVYFTKNRTILRRPYGARPAAGRIVRFLINFLDIVRCPVKFMSYLKFHGARTAFGWVNEGKMASAGHRSVPGRRPAGVCTHRTGTGRFCLKFISYDSNGARPGTVRCPAGHRTMSDKRQEL